MYFSILHTVISACLHSVYFTIYNVYCIILCVVIWLCLHCVYNVVLHVYFNILHVVIWVCLHSVYNCVIDVYLTILHGVVSVCITQCNWGVYWWFYNVYFECVYTPTRNITLCKIKGILCVYTWYWSKMEITHWYTVGTPYIHVICIAYCVWYTEYDVIWRHIMCITRCITRNSGPVIHLLPCFYPLEIFFLLQARIWFVEGRHALKWSYETFE